MEVNKGNNEICNLANKAKKHKTLISKEIVQTIIETARVEEVIGDFVNLKKRGANYVGLCPFHNEKTPSFSVSAAKGIYKCFGCGKAGNAVNFVMEHEHYSYPEALKYLAGKYNIEVEEEEPSPEYLQEQSEKESLYNVNEFARKYFSEILHHHNEGKAVGLTYLKERDFIDDSVERFQIGYCPDSWKEFTDHALKNGYNIRFLIKSGLTVERENGDYYDRFRGRIIFPIHNLTGRVLGFGARILKSDASKPKYVNSPESEIYIKSRILYGLYFAKSAIVSSDVCYLVEGYTDVISLFQNGVHNVVASSGTSLTVDQIRLIKRYTNNITILFDGDEAGLKASFRGIDLILEQGLNVKVVLFPEGEDPDSFARKNRPAEIKAFLKDNAQDFIRLRTGLLLEGVQDDPVKKAGLIKEVVGTISLIPDIITRSLYIRECASLMSIEEKTLVFELNRILRNKSKKKNTQNTFGEADAIAEEKITEPQSTPENIDHGYHEREIIRLLLTYSHSEILCEEENEFGHIDLIPVNVAVYIVNDLSVDDMAFENPLYHRVYSEYANAIRDQNEIPGSTYFTSNSDPEIMNLAVELLSEKYELSENWKKNKIFVNGERQQLQKTIDSSILTLRSKKISRILKKIQAKLKETDNDEELLELMNQNQQYKELLVKINQKLGRVVTP